MDGGATACSSSGAPGGASAAGTQAAPGEGGVALTKAVLARRTELRVMGRLPPLELLEALQERDPRAYQLYFRPGASGGGADAAQDGAAEGAGGAGGPSFVGCTPERLYARSGRRLASEAVAGTRSRGAPGDIEADFYLALDLLKSEKDHAEFTMTRCAGGGLEG